ncbi:hypothetical protein L1787_06340 [Acuticoccus sp. M5D2P5]|uniref:hypothetical protein n=1 Tax=Acuticoccus kalidii TaxID=2910977 RepID=UPI001F2E3AE9|nr:hypothetical protein [Acuticoccus kalidii]MCF3933032.1 hypothetical protein [Acuticoccus kalidii]
MPDTADAEKTNDAAREARLEIQAMWREKRFADLVAKMEADPVQDPNAYRYYILSLRRLDRPADSLKALEAARTAFPDNDSIAFMAARAESDPKKAKVILDEVIANESSSFRARALVRRAEIAMSEKAWEAAIADLDEAITRGEAGDAVDLEGAKVARLLAHVHVDADDATLAADAEALTVPIPEIVQQRIRTDLRELLLNAEDVRLGRFFEAIINRDPSAVQLRAFFVQMNSQFAAANRGLLAKHLEKLAEDGAELKPHLIALRAELNNAEGNPRAGIIAMREALAKNPDDQRLRFGIATNLANVGDLEEALSEFDAVIAATRDEAFRREARLEAAIAALKTGSQARADPYIEALGQNTTELTAQQKAVLARLVPPERAQRIGATEALPADEVFFDGWVRLFKAPGDVCVVWPFVGFLRSDRRRRTIIDIWRQRGVSVVTVDDPRRLSALAGIDPFFPARDRFNSALHETIAARGYRRHLAVGESLAGYTAILYGLETGALGALSFSGGTRIPRLEDLPDDRGRAHLSYLRSMIPNPDLDLGPLIEQRPEFVVHNHYGEGSVADVASAERSNYLPNVFHTAWPHDHHASAGYLERTGQYERVVDEFLEDTLRG